MARILDAVLGSLDSSTPLLDQEMSQDSRTTDLTPHPHGRGREDLPDLIAEVFSHKTLEGRSKPVILNHSSEVYSAGGFLAGGLLLDQVAVPDSYARILSPRCSLSPDEMNYISDIRNVLRVWGESDLAGRIAYFALGEDLKERGVPITFNRASNFLAGRLFLDQAAVSDSYARMLSSRPLSPDEMKHIRTVSDVCNVLRVWSEDDLAARIAYFASDEDLEDEDIPITDESACGFLSFFGAVKSEGRVSLTCSPEGWLCALWRFSDERRASLWFLDVNRVMFAATNANGDFIEIDGGGDVGNSQEVMTKLIEAGLLTWDLDMPNSGSFHPFTMSHDTVVSGLLPKMDYQQRMRFYSERTKMNVTFPPTGWNTSTPQTDDSRLTALSNL